MIDKLSRASGKDRDTVAETLAILVAVLVTALVVAVVLATRDPSAATP